MTYTVNVRVVVAVRTLLATDALAYTWRATCGMYTLFTWVALWQLLHGWVACRARESRSNLAGNRVLRLLAPQRFFAASDRLYLRVRTATSNRERR